MRLGHRTFGVIVALAACAAPLVCGTAQAAIGVAGASATVIPNVVAEPVIVLAAIPSTSSPTSVTLTAVNVAARAEGASLSGTVSLGDSAPVVAMQASDGRNAGAKAAEGAAGGNTAGNAAAANGTLGNSHALAVELSKASLAALGAVSVTLNYN